jgi:hypothetical protein
MPLKTDLLRQLSDLFVNDLRASQYYLQLSPEERRTLEKRLAQDAARGSRPLVPGALPEDIERTEQAAHDQLGLDLPADLCNVLAEIDGFSENGVTLYGTDQGLPDDQAYGPTIVAENLALWSGMPETVEEYLFIGDSDLWYFVFDLQSKRFAVLSRSTLEPVHSFSSAAELVNDMLAQALAISPEPEKDSPSVPGNTVPY